MNSENNLMHVKVGDTLYLNTGTRFGGGRVIPYSVFVVKRLTATQVITIDEAGREVRFRRDRGTQIGSNNYFSHARIPTLDMIEEREKAIAVRRAMDKVNEKFYEMQRLPKNRDQLDDLWLAVGKAIAEFELKEKV